MQYKGLKLNLNPFRSSLQLLNELSLKEILAEMENVFDNS